MSNEINTQPQIETMSSLQLVDIINEIRKAEGKRSLRHDHFTEKIESHPGIEAPKFLGHASCLMASGATRDEKCYHLPRRECDLLLMSESLAIQAKVYDRLSEVMQSSIHHQLTQAEVARIERDYDENLKHHPNYELGEKLIHAIRMEEFDGIAEIDKELDTLDMRPAARAEGISVEAVRRRVFTRVAGARLLRSMARGEHEHPSPVRDVVEWARSSVKANDARERMLATMARPVSLPNPTLNDIVAYDLATKYGVTPLSPKIYQ